MVQSLGSTCSYAMGGLLGPSVWVALAFQLPDIHKARVETLRSAPCCPWVKCLPAGVVVFWSDTLSIATTVAVFDRCSHLEGRLAALKVGVV